MVKSGIGIHSLAVCVYGMFDRNCLGGVQDPSKGIYTADIFDPYAIKTRPHGLSATPCHMRMPFKRRPTQQHESKQLGKSTELHWGAPDNVRTALDSIAWYLMQ